MKTGGETPLFPAESRCNQHHPDASPGPHDAGFLFEEFRRLIGRNRRKQPRRAVAGFFLTRALEFTL
jgi:hypothetical protein